MAQMGGKIKEVFEEIYNTLSLLSDSGLTVYHHRPVYSKREGLDLVTWPNHQSGRYNCENFFGRIEQYKKIIGTEAFSCLLFDGSFVRAAYGFDSEGLSVHNLLWWPSPFRISREDLTYGGVLDIFDLYAEDWQENIKMRTPVRFDYDAKKASMDHPASHVHLQSPNCRLYVDKPVSFNIFIKFIFKNFYSEQYSAYDFWDDLRETQLVRDAMPEPVRGEIRLGWHG